MSFGGIVLRCLLSCQQTSKLPAGVVTMSTVRRVSTHVHAQFLQQPYAQVPNAANQGFWSELLRNDASEQPIQYARSRYIQRQHGMVQYAEKIGIGRNVVLFLPGLFGTTQSDFSKQLFNINKEIFTMVAMDHIGFGNSYPPDRNWRDDYLMHDATCAAATMEEIEERRRYSVVGIDEGGLAALMLAASFPRRIRKVVTIGTWSDRTQGDINKYRRLVQDRQWLSRLNGSFEYAPGYVQRNVEQWLDVQQDQVNHYINNIFTHYMLAVQCPVLVLHGENDRLVNVQHAYNIKNSVPYGRLYTVPGAGHHVQKDKYRLVNSVIESFLVGSYVA